MDPCLWVLTLRVQQQFVGGGDFVYKYFACDSSSRAVFEEPGEPRRIFLGGNNAALGVEQEDIFSEAIPCVEIGIPGISR